MASIFIDKTVKPNDELLSKALGRSFKNWESIQSKLESDYGTITPEWKFYGPKSGWTLKMLLKKRNLFFFSPGENFFTIAFVFGDKAVQAIEKSDLPADLVAELKNSKRYPEGRALRIPVKRQSQVKDIIKLAGFKINC